MDRQAAGVPEQAAEIDGGPWGRWPGRRTTCCSLGEHESAAPARRCVANAARACLHGIADVDGDERHHVVLGVVDTFAHFPALGTTRHSNVAERLVHGRARKHTPCAANRMAQCVQATKARPAGLLRGSSS